MQSKAQNPEQYIAELPAERQVAISHIRAQILDNLPLGYAETMQYGMLSYVVPHSLYPAGYHCKPTDALPFISLASQKNYVSLYHMGLYTDSELTHWFTNEYAKTGYKLDLGKGCIRFKNLDKIPYQLIGQLCSKITPQQWIDIYEKNIKN
jgi:hypothetical protein